MKKISKTIALFLIIVNMSCGVFGSLTSNTTIEPKNSFVLGDNNHGSFNVKLKNTSTEVLRVYRKPITGGMHSSVNVNPNETISVKVETDTALIIENNSNATTNVYLKVTGDIGLAMTYKK